MENPLNQELYTEKAWGAIAKLPQYGEKYQTQSLESTHLFKCLIDEGPSGLTQRIISKSGVSAAEIDAKLDEYFRKQPKIYDTSSKVMGKSLQDCLQKAIKIRKDFSDLFVSTEHLLLAMAEGEGFPKKLLRDLGSDEKKIRDAVDVVRGNNKVTSRSAEDTYEALKKYSRDLTEAAANGKLDPVIGRDEEIRRAIQILSRRTKNNPILLGEVI